ncbi:unnamed protein product [Caenorhabditis auriculariae]|uniref:Tr-type G domain-containing protein n=1 Tax=Caenorhabditis auriculariae TaxID=2777116 RepID=A0A8S1H2T7_9PELO|nr:unnamed protein product [Caenorhabditis auriculariae]
MIRCLWLKSRSISPSVRFSSSSENVGVNRIRNIGIVAHVDAGKTTVTEQLLYLTGTTKSVGEVDSGSTVTDFLDMERERGITIQSAAVTFNWMQHRINLIDTPGHVDFTVEVERCLRVLDGIVTVLDGSAGVQAQTLTVWKQAQRFGLPAIFFVNKLDKKGADFKKTVDDVKQKLGVEALCTVIPKADFSGIIDLISGSQLSFNAGRNAEWQEIKEKTHDFDQLLAQRSDLCLEVAGQHEGFMEHFLEECSGQVDRVDSSALLRAIREVTLGGKAATVTCGSVLKSTSCARPILDHVVNFLPAPNERSAQLGHLFGDELAGFVFKVTHDKRRGHLCYVRVYNGTLKNNSSVFNSNQFRMEGPLKVFVPYADELRQAKEVGAGNIAVVAGLSHSVTGDSLLANQAVATSVNEKLHTELKQSHEGPDNHRKSAHDVYPNDSTGSSKNRSDSKKAAIGLQPREDGEGKTVVFSGIEIPDSVYFCCVEPPSTKSLHEAKRYA